MNLDVLTELIESGAVTPVINRMFPLEVTADALRHYGQDHTRSKVVITCHVEERG